MANKNLFTGTGNGGLKPADAINAAGGKAYKLSDAEALAQFAATGTFGDTFYTSAVDQLDTVLKYARNVTPEFIAKLAVYSRESGKMKDMPALLVAILFARGEDRLVRKVFNRVIDNGRMLRTFVQIVRSGKLGRKSLGTFGKKLIQKWFDDRNDALIFRDSVGNDPSLADVIKLAHPNPKDPSRQALFRYIIGKELNAEQTEALPQVVKNFEAFKQARLALKAGKPSPVQDLNPDVPDVPFQMLTALPLTTEDWTRIALKGGWHFIRMNLNTFARHDVFKSKIATKTIADILRDPKAIEKARVLPYQLLMAFTAAENVPAEISIALQDAMEHATKNVPAFNAPNGVLVFPDVSGSMDSPVTGERAAASKMTCTQVAALFASAVLRTNPGAEVLPFDTRVHLVRLNPRDSVMTNAQKLNLRGGGTDCSVALAAANAANHKADLVIYVSDNASWVDARPNVYGSTGTMHQWRLFKRRNPAAKMVNINITPASTTQASNDKDILNIGGFSDAIFETINNFVSAKTGESWVSVIEKISLE